MRPRALALFLLLAACRGPYRPFDSGHDVHLIVLATPAPRKGISVRPVCELGGVETRCPKRRLGGGEPAAAEVAVLRAPRGDLLLRVRDPLAKRDGEVWLDVDHELWVVFEIGPGQTRGRFSVSRKPPHGRAGAWAPLAVVPD